MSLEYLEILEKRVQEMIDLVKHLREKNVSLEEELIQQKEAFHQLQEERGEVRRRVERILGTLSPLDEAEETISVEREGEQETPG